MVRFANKPVRRRSTARLALWPVLSAVFPAVIEKALLNLGCRYRSVIRLADLRQDRRRNDHMRQCGPL